MLGHSQIDGIFVFGSTGREEILQLDLLVVLRDLALNTVAVSFLVFGMYFRRHRRRDFAVGYIAFNTSLFVVAVSLGSSAPLSLGVGFGLFAILSIVRLRSDEATWNEIGYTMVSLVLGLITGLPGVDFALKLLLAVVLVGALYIVDHPLLMPAHRYQRYRVSLDTVILDPEHLRGHLSERLGGDVLNAIVQEVDFVQETMRVDVRLRKSRIPAHVEQNPKVGEA